MNLSAILNLFFNFEFIYCVTYRGLSKHLPSLDLFHSWRLSPCSTLTTFDIFSFLFIFRRSRSYMFCKIGILRNFAIFTGENLCWSLFLIKQKGLTLEFYLKKTLAQVFSFGEIFKKTFFWFWFFFILFSYSEDK